MTPATQEQIKVAKELNEGVDVFIVDTIPVSPGATGSFFSNSQQAEAGATWTATRKAYY